MSLRVQEYTGQDRYVVRIGDLVRELPIVQVSENVWIASNADLILGDVEFIEVAANLLAEKIKQYSPDIIVAPEAKAIALTYEVAKKLGHKKLVIARKSVKAYMVDYLAEEFSSITTKSKQLLIFVKNDVYRIRDNKVCILDDVVSTGGTVNALDRLVRRAGGKVACKAAIWIEGPWYKGDLIYLDELPIFLKSS